MSLPNLASEAKTPPASTPVSYIASTPRRTRPMTTSALAECPALPNGSKIRMDSLGWEGHGHSNCLPCAMAAHPSDCAVRNLSPRARRGATRRWGRTLRRRPLWWRALWRWARFQRALQRKPRWRTLRLAALLVRKAVGPGCGIRSVIYFGYFAPWAVTELRHAGPHVILFEGSVDASLVPRTISTPPRRPSPFRFFSRASSSRFLLQTLSAVFFLRMLVQRRDPGLLL